jgi:hypothetical protein
MTTDLGTAAKAALVGEIEGLRDSVRELAGPLDEKQFWTRPLTPGNSFGHLVLHLTGNLNWFVGAKLGNSGYVREREREFTEENPPAKGEALTRLDDAVATFRRVVSGLTDEQLTAPFVEMRFGTVVNALVHWTAHFALHRGQMSYITRLVQPGS